MNTNSGLKKKMRHEVRIMRGGAPYNRPLLDDAMQDCDDSLRLGGWQLMKSQPTLRDGFSLPLGPDAYFGVLEVDSDLAIVLILGEDDWRFGGWVEGSRGDLAKDWVERLNSQLKQSRLIASKAG